MPVYKDECVYTFDSVESPRGIDVCLTCKLAFSPARGFTSLHTALTSHDSFVNIRKTARDRPAKQLKLAIDAQTDADLWETHTAVIPGSLEPAIAEKLAKEVMEADSYNKQQEIVAWELEIKECAHSRDLSQEKSTDTSLGAAAAAAHCSQCELDNNLWMCLSCGTLSCGRQQFGGGGGNGHALVHYDATKHPLAVKLGSITPEGHADVFCYACDDEVKDPQIKTHLAVFGVDIASAQKTEKSMAELQLEQNAKFDFSMQDESGKDLEPVSGPGLTGMRNLGNTCYLNSVLQCLMSLKGFTEYFPGNTTGNVLESQDPPNNLNIQLGKLQNGLNSGEYTGKDPHSEMGYQRGITPAMFKHLVGRDHPEFATMKQQDTCEFLSHLFTKISQAAAKEAKPDPVSALFGFETNRRIQCLKCGSVKYKPAPQESLSIQVPIERDQDSALKPVSFDQLLEVETAPETIQLDCPVCSEKQTMKTNSGFKSYPQNFILNVRRFELVNWVPQKVDVPVEVPKEISLKPYEVRRSEGETIMEEESEQDNEQHTDFEPNREVLDQLTAMGFPYGKCVRALESTGNINPEAAMNWLLLPEEEQIPVKPPSSASRQASTKPDPEQIETLGEMGFTTIQAEAALKVNNNNVEAAVEWLFAGNAENAEKFLDAAECPQSLGDDGPTNYKLKGIICHKGGSVHAGHYVAFVEREGEWYLFNDEKVVKGADIEEMQKFAYLYIFERNN